MRRPSQNQRVLDWLESGRAITQEDCDRMHPKIKRLAARIRDLKDRFEVDESGRKIISRAIKSPGGASVAEYRLLFPWDGQAALFPQPDRGRPR